MQQFESLAYYYLICLKIGEAIHKKLADYYSLLDNLAGTQNTVFQYSE